MIRLALVLAVLILPPQEVSEAQKREFVEKSVNKAVENGLRVLREGQGPDGSFSKIYPHGVTALALYTLLALGGTLEDPAASKALDWLLSNAIDWTGGGGSTYQISLVAVALSYCIPQLPKGDRRDRTATLLQRSADWLVANQEPGGGWGYGLTRSSHDHSNSQFAVLGLRAAANAGAKVKREVWEREYTHYKTSQQQDGGWGYRNCYAGRSRRGGSTSTMTAAGVMGLAMTIGSLTKARPEQMTGDPAIKKGLMAMGRQWGDGLSERLKVLGGVPYLLYSIERACMLTGQKRLGSVDWYVEGAWLIINEQTPEGQLQIISNRGSDSTASHCFCLLFLKRAFVPVVTPSNTKPKDTPTGTSGTPPPSDSSNDKPREME